jgi:NAD(P)-dependent dehydrogenase (short-subunit alcohol dehydrogenase family)
LAKLDIFIGNGGSIGRLTPLAHVDPKLWDEVMAVNVTPLASHPVARSSLLLRQSDTGPALFVTSGVARRSPLIGVPYAVSKAALEALVKT